MKFRLALIALAASTALAGCSYTEPADIGRNMEGMDHGSDGMDGMDHGGDHAHEVSGDGLDVSRNGYMIDDASIRTAAGTTHIEYRIKVAEGATQLKYVRENEQLMHMLLINEDFSQFIHVHPVIDATGAWVIDLPEVSPGMQHLVAQFVAIDRSGAETALILGVDLDNGGVAPSNPLEAETPTDKIDGMVATLKGTALAETTSGMTFTVAKNGEPVTLTPYLGNWLHITAINTATKAVTHVHPEAVEEGEPSPKSIPFDVELPEAGTYLFVVEFATEDGTVHASRFVRTVS